MEDRYDLFLCYLFSFEIEYSLVTGDCSIRRVIRLLMLVLVLMMYSRMTLFSMMAQMSQHPKLNTLTCTGICEVCHENGCPYQIIVMSHEVFVL